MDKFKTIEKAKKNKTSKKVIIAFCTFCTFCSFKGTRMCHSSTPCSQENGGHNFSGTKIVLLKVLSVLSATLTKN